MGVVVVTGASSGIGLAAARALARGGAEVVLVGRHPGRLAAAVDRVREAGGRTPAAHRADFGVLDEVRDLAGKLRAEYPRIDVLANNAGRLVPRRMTTVDGHELTIQVNHLAGFLLSHLLLDRLAGGRVITTASAAEVAGRLDPEDLSGTGRRYGGWLAYASSKQANILFTREAATRWAGRGVTPTCFHPGAVRTRFGAGGRLSWMYRFVPFLVSPQRGADTLVWLATSDEGGGRAGGYFIRREARAPSGHSRDPVVAARLWDASLAAVGL